MEEQGVENIESIEIGEQQGDEKSPNQYQGYIHWTDGTKTKVLIKGRRPKEFATASYRESLFYSRIADGIQDSVKSPGHFLAVADVTTGDCLLLEEFMTEYVSLESVYLNWHAGTLDDIGVDPASFDMVESQISVFSMLGHFAGSRWMDEDLKKEFWMKNYDEA